MHTNKTDCNGYPVCKWDNKNKACIPR